jgi:hypothetical protein
MLVTGATKSQIKERDYSEWRAVGVAEKPWILSSSRQLAPIQNNQARTTAALSVDVTVRVRTSKSLKRKAFVHVGNAKHINTTCSSMWSLLLSEKDIVLDLRCFTVLCLDFSYSPNSEFWQKCVRTPEKNTANDSRSRYRWPRRLRRSAVGAWLLGSRVWIPLRTCVV